MVPWQRWWVLAQNLCKSREQCGLRQQQPPCNLTLPDRRWHLSHLEEKVFFQLDNMLHYNLFIYLNHKRKDKKGQVCYLILRRNQQITPARVNSNFKSKLLNFLFSDSAFLPKTYPSTYALHLVALPPERRHVQADDNAAQQHTVPGEVPPE